MSTPILPDLELLKVIGSGSYGEVWLARTVTGLYRAVKIVGRARFEDERPWLREFAGISRFQKDMGSRPRQLALLHVGEDKAQGLFYYIMELADDLEKGSDFDPATYQPATLKAVCAKNKEMPFDEVLRIGIDLARSLAELHGAGLIHRDVKPSNIVFIQGVPKLADLGLVSSSDHSLTSLGTPGFSPPEGTGTPRSDIFSLGRILYEMAMRRPSSEYPFLPPELASAPDGPRLMELNEILLAACDPNPLKRYPNAEALLTDLLHIQAGGSLIEMARLRDRLRKATIAAKWAALVLFVIGAGFGIRHYQAIRQLATEEAAGRVRAEAEERQARYVADLQLAHLGVQASDFGIARAALSRQIPSNGAADLRGAEWRVLWNQLKGDDTKRWDLGRPINAAVSATTATQQLCLQPEDSRSAILVNLGKDTSIESLGSDIRRIGEQAPNGHFLGCTWADDIVDLVPGNPTPVLWPEGKGRLLTSTPRFGVFVKKETQTAFSLRIRDRETHLEIARWDSPEARLKPNIRALALSNDGRYLLIDLINGQASGGIRTILRDLQTNQDVWTQADDILYQKTAFSPDGHRIAILGSEIFRVLDARTGACLWECTAEPGILTSLAWSPDGHLLAVGGDKARIGIYDSFEKQHLITLRGPETPILSLAWNPEGKTLISAEAGGIIRSFELKVALESHERKGLVSSRSWGYANFIFDKNPDRVLATQADQTTALFDRKSWAKHMTWPAALMPLGHSHANAWYALSKTGSLLECSLDGSTREGGLSLKQGLTITDWASSPDGTRCAFAMDAEPGTLVVWDLAHLKEQELPAGPLTLRMTKFSGDGSLVAVSDNKHGIRVLELATMHWGEWIGRKGVQAYTVVFSADNKRLIAGYVDGSLQEINLGTGQTGPLVEAHHNTVSGLQLLDGEKTLLSTSKDGTYSFWRTNNWRRILTATNPRAYPDASPASIYGLRGGGPATPVALLGTDGSVQFLDESANP